MANGKYYLRTKFQQSPEDEGKDIEIIYTCAPCEGGHDVDLLWVDCLIHISNKRSPGRYQDAYVIPAVETAFMDGDELFKAMVDNALLVESRATRKPGV